MMGIPKYNKELHYFTGIKACFVIEGNINDIYPIYDYESESIQKFGNLLNLLSGIFGFDSEQGKTDLIYCDANIGFENPLYTDGTASLIQKYEKLAEDEKNSIRSINGKAKREHHSSHKVILNSEIIRKALTEPINAEQNEKPVTVVLDNASRLCVNSGNLTVDEMVIFSNLQYAVQNAYSGNSLILICEKANDLPDWLRKNSNIKTIMIPPPSRDIRESFIKSRIELKAGDEKTIDKLIDFSDKLQLSELNQLNMLYQNSELTLKEAMTIYRFGLKDKLWLQMKERINHISIEEELSKRIKGQQHAISAVADAVRKASNGMNNLSNNASNTQPPIRALFAGPTGVGKTELIKALSDLVYADERAIVRFDCGEYSTEGSEAKLIGSPPGYVGYGNSGELINALKQNPNCILLFDEIEKAHDRVFTLLLGLLDDGRITSGDGETVFASDAMIFFTSNVGIAKIIRDPATGEKKKIVNVGPTASHEELEKTVIKEINNYFKPEFIGRLSDIIAFDYLSESVAIDIMKVKVENIVKNLYEQNKLTLIVYDSVIDYLISFCKQKETIIYGGRTIKNLVEKTLENSVCSFVISHPDVKNIIASVENSEIICREG